MGIVPGHLAKAMRLLGLGLVALVGQAGAMIGGWGALVAWNATLDGLGSDVGDGWPVWYFFLIGLIAAGGGSGLIAAALIAGRWLHSGLAIPRWRLLSLMVAMDSIGITVGLGFWLNCYHQADLTKTYGVALMGFTLIVGTSAALFSRPGPTSAVLAIPALVVAMVTYQYLVDSTSATRCSGYQPPSNTPPTTAPATQPANGVGQDQRWPTPLTTGPPTPGPATSVPPATSGSPLTRPPDP